MKKFKAGKNWIVVIVFWTSMRKAHLHKILSENMKEESLGQKKTARAVMNLSGTPREADW